MQTSFFSSAQNVLDEGIHQLNNFEFDEAIRLFVEAKEYDPTIANVDFYTEIASRLKKFGLNGKSPAGELVNYWTLIKNAQRERGAVEKFEIECLQILAKQLLRIDEFDENGVVPNADYFLHESTLHLHLGNAKTTYQLLVDVYPKVQADFPARYWGYLADAAIELDDRKLANQALTRLLASDPDQIDWVTCGYEKIRSHFTGLKALYPLEMAYALLPFKCWQYEIVHIPKGNQFLADILEEREKHYRDSGDYSEVAKTHLFGIYIFMEAAENEPRPENRERMADLNPVLFKEYLKEKEYRLGG